MAQINVSTFSELKSAVEDGISTEIFLLNDITFTGGIKIPVSKSSLTIDGNGHTITDMNSTAYTDALYVPAATSPLTVTVKNAVWSGRNYYGVICVYDAASNTAVTAVLENLTYRGPQMIYHRYGTTKIVGCTVSIEKNGASATPQEFAEANRLIFSGVTRITSVAASSAVIWFPFASASLTVDQNATLTIDAPNTYLIYSDSAAKPALAFMENSSTQINVKSGLFYASGTGAHIASSCVISAGASFAAEASANGGVPLFKCAGDFTVHKNASLRLAMPAKGTSPLLYFSAAATVSITEPKNVVLYSNGGKVFSFASGSTATPNKIHLNAGQINFWTTAKTPYASAGGFDDLPLSALKKQNGENVSVEEKLSSSAFLSAESNLTEGDGGYPVSATNFDLSKAAVLSAGQLKITPDRLTDISEAVSGTTEAGAQVKITTIGQNLQTTANGNGVFSAPLAAKLAVGETAVIQANINFLTETVSEIVQGSVSVSYLPDIPFNAFVAPKSGAKVARLTPDLRITLKDTRPDGGAWRLYVTLETPLQSGDESIENAVTFAENSSAAVLTSAPLLIKEGVSSGAGTIEISWQEAEGILLSFSDSEAYKKGKYSATLQWNAEF